METDGRESAAKVFCAVVPGGTGDFYESFYYENCCRIAVLAAVDAFIKNRKRWITVV